MKRFAIGPALLWCGLAVCMAARARAEPQRVVLVLTPSGDDAALTEITARVRGELAGAGFRVVTREAPVGVSPLRAVAQAGADLTPSAVLWIVAASGHRAEHPNLEIWLSDRLLGRVSMARLTNASGESSDPSTLAVQAVELLSARLSELRVASASAADADASWIEQQRPAEEPAPQREPLPPQRTRTDSRRRRDAWFGIGAGVGVLFGSGNLPALPMPVLRAVWSLGEPQKAQLPLTFDLCLSAAGVWPEQTVRNEHGSARIDQTFSTLSPTLRVVTRVPIEPFLGLGAGVYSLGVRGYAEAPYQDHDLRLWSALGKVALGVRTRPWAHLSFGASAELLGTLSRASVHIADRLVARAGGGMWFLRADLTGVF